MGTIPHFQTKSTFFRAVVALVGRSRRERRGGHGVAALPERRVCEGLPALSQQHHGSAAELDADFVAADNGHE